MSAPNLLPPYTAPRRNEHVIAPDHGPLGRANLFNRCATCGKSITRISRTGKVGKWRHTE